MVFTGLLFALNPERLRRRLRRKGARKVRRYLFIAGFAAGALVMSIGSDYEGWKAMLCVGVGLMIIAKAVFFLKGKASNLIAERLMDLPALYLRLYALVQVLIGGGIMWLQKSG